MTEEDYDMWAYVALSVGDEAEFKQQCFKPTYSKPNKTKDLMIGMFFIGGFIFMVAALHLQ